MNETTAKDLIIDELKLEGNTILESALDTHWSRFASEGDINLQYLLTKRAMCRTLLAQAKNKVDVEIGYDMLKHSQSVSNLKKIIDDINDEIEESYPGRRVPDMGVASSTAFLYED